MNSSRRFFALFTIFAMGFFCTISLAKEAVEYAVSTVASGFKSPWAMEFLPNGDILVTERSGKLRLVRDGKLLPDSIDGVPDVYYAGQGGLLDVMLDQDFNTNNKLYLSYAHGTPKGNATRLMSAVLKGQNLVEQKILFTASPLKKTAHHYAARIAQFNDGTLLLSVGDGFDYRERAQRLDNHFGKIVRINQNGKAPKDNPFFKNKGALPEIWSYGHRNHQALVIQNGKVFENEHGPKGGDEVNIIEPGMNYGWPVITRGVDYNGAQITPYTEYEGMQVPLVDWTPSIAPSSMTWHQDALYVTTLAEGSIRRLSVSGDTVFDEGIVFPELSERLRDIASGPDGNLYVLTDGEPAKLLKIISKP